MYTIPKREVKSINLTLFSRASISLKFKTRLYYSNMNGTNNYVQSEYIYNKGNEKTCSVSITLLSNLELNIMCNIGKKYLYISDAQKHKISRKLSKMIGYLEAYDSDEIDLLSVSSTGTKINSGFKERKQTIKLGENILQIEVVYRDHMNDVGVILQSDEYVVDLSYIDFMELYYKIRNSQFEVLTMESLNYMNTISLGENTVDFRPDRVDTYEPVLPPVSTGRVNNIDLKTTPTQLPGRNMWSK